MLASVGAHEASSKSDLQNGEEHFVGGGDGPEGVLHMHDKACPLSS